jgi:hypothetical protein
MNKKTDCLTGLYQEFAHYYAQHRCPWAPASPDRIFNLCFKRVFHAYRKWMSPAEFLAAIYRTLGIPGVEPAGLFQKFDPKKYNGRLSPEDHFVSLFRTNLKGNLGLELRRVTDRGQRDDRENFGGHRVIEFLEEGTKFSRYDVEAVESLPEALLLLEGEELRVIKSRYWDGDSNRKIGLQLGMDHKTVKRRHDAALAKLRRFYEAGAA